MRLQDIKTYLQKIFSNIIELLLYFGRYLGMLPVRTLRVSGHFLLCSQGDSIRQRHGDGCRVPVSHHLFINLKSFTYNSISEDADVFFSLYDSREAKQIRYVKES